MASVMFTTSVIGTRRPATLTKGTSSSSSSSSSDVSSSTPKTVIYLIKIKIKILKTESFLIKLLTLILNWFIMNMRIKTTMDFFLFLALVFFRITEISFEKFN